MKWAVVVALAAACAGSARAPAPPRVVAERATASLEGDGRLHITVELRVVGERASALRAADWELSVADRPVARGRVEARGTRLDIELGPGQSARVLARRQEAGRPLRLDATLHFDGGAAKLELPALLLQGDEPHVGVTGGARE